MHNAQCTMHNGVAVRQSTNQQINKSTPFFFAIGIAAPLLFVGVWLNGASTDPIYGAPEVGYRAILSEIERDAGAETMLS